jgi:zeaxanthin glucosyltransferase
MGTIQNGDAEVFRTIAAAVAEKDAQLVMSIGSVLRPEQIGPVPRNAIVVNHAPPIGTFEKGVNLYHPCGIEHCAGVSDSRCPSTRDSGD